MGNFAVSMDTKMDTKTDTMADTSPTSTMTTNTDISLQLNEIVQEYANADGPVTRVIDGISLSFDKPTINMLLGPSGCGKSTLLHMMGGVRPFGVQSPTSGSVHINGEACDGPHDDAVMVFQRYANRPDLTVYENVAFPFRLGLWKKKFPEAEWKKRVDDMLEAVGLTDKKHLSSAQLSGGQNQRVALARALVLRPRILLMDEPFGALDAQTREEMQQLLITLHKTSPCLIVFVTHDVTEALLLGDRVIVLSTQPAKIADDFEIIESRPRSAVWQRSTEAVTMQERVLSQLHKFSAGRGTLRVTI
ncbi:ABC transporter ATP-binding protein [Undibacterium sp. Ji83W]|uniref:ABC transporter ATP-binding protein n=1 Tax=Undibacterium sp. Ji83W TaxID=3413043 RepID=UPI003BF01B8B